MRFEYQPHLTESSPWYKGVYDLLAQTEAEFVPPLHTRCSTTQRDLSNRHFSSYDNLWAYFESMIAQQFIVAICDDEVSGFLSFRKDKEAFYVSTIAVEPDKRNQGIGRGLYEALFATIGQRKTFTTRTWTTNLYHRRILDALGFRIYLEKDEGRIDINGTQVPSLYYIKESAI